ncbi:hypothetical protein [Curtobacterium oceanosedimentum]|uniref:hypothetical protein n=1 Tax=Curtobacterium oceanosedimentum TaxID=465820 RepID=UPI003397E31A
MTNVTPLHRGHVNPDVTAVADEVRGMLAKRRIATYKLPELLQDGTSRGYWQRRVSGDIPFDVADLSAVAGVLGVSINELVPSRPTPTAPNRGATD